MPTYAEQEENKSVNILSHYWQQYNLARDPFAKSFEADMTYISPIWEEHLDLIHHLIKTENALITIRGTKGVGKTSFMQHYCKQFDDSFTVRQTIAQITWDNSKLLKILYQAFQIKPQPTNLSSDSFSEELETFIANIQYSQTTSVFIIDKAQLLSFEILNSILFLLEQQSINQMRLHIILIGDQELEDHLTELLQHKISNVPIRNLEIQPYTLLDTTSYIQHRLSKAGALDDVFFTTADIEYIHRKSGGIPENINSVCQQFLIKKLNSKKKSFPLTTHNSFSFLQKHKSKLLGSMIFSFFIIIISLFLTYHSHNNISEATVQTTKIYPEKNISKNKYNQLQNIHYSAAQINKAKRALDQLVSIQIPTATNTNQIRSVKHDNKIIAADVVKAKKLIHALVKQQQIKSKSLTPEYLTLNTAQKNSIQNNLVDVNTSSQVEKQFEFNVKNSKSNKIEVIRLPVSPTYSAQALTTSDDNQKTILGLNKNKYTLQIIALSNEKELQRYIKNHKLTGSYYYRFKRRSHDLFVLIYGEYATVAEATAAKNKLVSQLPNDKPWVRNIASVQYEILPVFK